MKLKDYMEKRGISNVELSRRLCIDERIIAKCLKTPPRVSVDTIITIVNGTNGLVTANDLLGLTKVKPSYKAMFETPLPNVPKNKSQSSTKRPKK